MPDANLTKLILRSLVASARGACGTKLFQHMYVRDKRSGQEFDTMRGGELSCAFFVSGLLAMYGLLDGRSHSTVTTVMQKMLEAGWYKIDTPKSGAVVHWPVFEGYDHLGFCVGEAEYVSNSLAERTPIKHGLSLSDGRRPDAYYWHPKLDQD